MAMQCSVAAQVDRLALAVAEDHVRVVGLEALPLGEQPVVEAELMDDVGLDVARELGVEHLVGIGAQIRCDLDAAQEVGAALPATVEERRLVDQRHAVAHRRLGVGGAPLEALGSPGLMLAQVGVLAPYGSDQDRKALGLVEDAALADEVGVRVAQARGLAAQAERDAPTLLREMQAAEVVRQVGRREDQHAVGGVEH